MKGLRFFALWTVCVWSLPADGGTISVSYTSLPQGTLTDLTAAGTSDWVKWGNGKANGPQVFSTVEKIGGTIINSALTMIDPTAPGPPTVVPASFSPSTGPPDGSILRFNWADGTAVMAGGGPVNNVVTQTMTPSQFSYPIGLGQSFTAAAAAVTQVLDVYVQGFGSDMLLTAALSGGGTQSLTIAPTVNPVGDPSNFYSLGRFRIVYSGLGETLTASTQSVNMGARVGARHSFPMPECLPRRSTTFPNRGAWRCSRSEACSLPESPSDDVGEVLKRLSENSAPELPHWKGGRGSRRAVIGADGPG